MNTPKHYETRLTESNHHNPTPFTELPSEGKSLEEGPGELLDSGFELTELLMD
jgi:hypothetical protein